MGGLGNRLRLISKEPGQGALVRHRREPVFFRRVAQTVLEFMKRAYVVDMNMGRDSQYRLAASEAQEPAKGLQPHAEVDDEIGIPSRHVKEVGPEEGMHIWLPDPKDLIGNPFSREPVR
ncbi:hypothetical protein SAMN03159463_05130 [Mesorhizobium sp. NFR06]|nr:hypothetical protein SAMN03159463_05130 [Mesorhizobium sp. NFR06]